MDKETGIGTRIGRVLFFLLSTFKPTLFDSIHLESAGCIWAPRLRRIYLGALSPQDLHGRPEAAGFIWAP